MSIHLQHAHRLAAGVAMLAASVCSFAESRLAGTTPREAFGSEPVARLVGSALNGDSNGISKALADGADINAVGTKGVTPLVWVELSGTASSRAGAASATADGSARALGRGGGPKGAAPAFAQAVADFVAALVTALKGGGSGSSVSPAVPGAAYAGAGTDVGSALKRLIDAPSAASTGTAAQTATADLERAFSRLLSSIAPPAGAAASAGSAATADGAPTLGSFLATLARQLEQTPAGLLSPGSVFRSVA